MQSDAVVPIERLTLQERAYEQLKRLIVSGNFAPGEVVTIRSLASSLGTSIMPVRDALQKLAVDQAIIASPNRSFRIATLPTADLVEMTMVRKQLEGLAAAIAAGSISDLELTKLRGLRDVSHRAAVRRDAGALLEANRALCSQILRSSRSPYLERLIQGLWLRLGPTLRSAIVRLFQEEGRKERLEMAHDGVVDALLQRDSEAARQAMEEDIGAEFEVMSRYATIGSPRRTKSAPATLRRRD